MEENITGNKKLILLVDDEPKILNFYSATLEKEGYEIIKASNGMEGIKMAKIRRPDLILIDLNMPVMDGMEALMKLKEGAGTKNLKIVFLTSSGEPRGKEIDVKFAKEAGAVGFMQKGGSLNEFISEIKRHLAE